MNNNPNLHEEVIQLHASICSALADANRIMILYALAAQPLCVKDLAAEVGLSQPTTSRHLKILRENGLVRTNRQGPSIEYRLTDQRLIEALDLLMEVLRDRIAYRAGLIETDFAGSAHSDS